MNHNRAGWAATFIRTNLTRRPADFCGSSIFPNGLEWDFGHIHRNQAEIQVGIHQIIKEMDGRFDAIDDTQAQLCNFNHFKQKNCNFYAPQV